MINKTKIAIIKNILESDEVAKYDKTDFIKLVVDTEVIETEVDGKNKSWVTIESGTNPL